MALQRALLVEAGHRCAIPACRQWPTEFAHITPYKTVREHTFENLIVLCPTCHSRYDNTKEIDRKSVLQYKQNLAVLNGRYTDVERQLLKEFLRHLADVAEMKATDSFPPTGGDGEISSEILAFIYESAALSRMVRIHSAMAWMISNLVDDGIVELKPIEETLDSNETWEVMATGDLRTSYVSLTPRGREFIEKWRDAEPI